MNHQISDFIEAFRDLLERISDTIQKRKDDYGFNTIQFSSGSAWSGWYEMRALETGFSLFNKSICQYLDNDEKSFDSIQKFIDELAKNLSEYQFDETRIEEAPCIIRNLERIRSDLIDLVKKADLELLRNEDVHT